jgi:hypothetical protein
LQTYAVPLTVTVWPYVAQNWPALAVPEVTADFQRSLPALSLAQVTASPLAVTPEAPSGEQ